MPTTEASNLSMQKLSTRTIPAGQLGSHTSSSKPVFSKRCTDGTHASSVFVQHWILAPPGQRPGVDVKGHAPTSMQTPGAPSTLHASFTSTQHVSRRPPAHTPRNSAAPHSSTSTQEPAVPETAHIATSGPPSRGPASRGASPPSRSISPESAAPASSAPPSSGTAPLSRTKKRPASRPPSGPDSG